MGLLERRREELTDLLTSAYAQDRISQELFDELIGAVECADDSSGIARVARMVADALRSEDPPEDPPEDGEAIPDPVTSDSDHESVAGIVEAFYAAISWRGDRRPEIDELVALLDDRQARFVQGGDNMDVGQFWFLRVGSWVRSAQFPFRQREISGATRIYGRLAHRLSVYVAERAHGDVVGRGVSSFQLARNEAGWHIISVVWEEERDDLPIPAGLLGRR